MDDRATSSAVGKLLGVGLVLLYLAGATSLMYGSVVPDARRATGQELAERTVGAAAARVERVLEPVGGRFAGRATLSLPPTIGGRPYRLRLADGGLRLVHPAEGIAATAPLDLPPSVAVVDSTADSGEGGAIVVEGDAGNRTLRLVEGER